MNKSSRALLVLAALAGLIASAPLALPYQRLIPDLQSQLGQRLHSKITIGQIDFSYLPRPAFTLKQVRIENREIATIGTITIPASLRLLLSAGRDLDEIQARNISLPPHFALALPGIFSTTGSNDFRIRKVRLANASLVWKQESLGPADAMLDFKPDGTIDNLTLESADGHAVLQIRPTNRTGNFDVLFNAKDWKPPFNPGIKFDAIRLEGLASADSLRITEARASLYDGALTGNARLDWHQRPTLTGQISARGIKAEPLLSLFSPETRVSGQLAGDGIFRYESATIKTLLDAPRLQGNFILNEGMIHNLDLASALKSTDAGPRRQGGQTSFSLFSGNIRVQGRDVSLRNLKLEAGKFRAQGEATIRAGKLAGGATLTLASGNILAGGHVTFGGTLAAPELQSGGTWRPAPDAGEETQ
ncbi:AsmA-like C-terminal region [Formivibrio citricus]|uniref:AsmA-like C-terminal region n=1 Tax=Formivibrio citricus TaxID=83765 RepID=A0A1I4XYB4_9NEIS|nr:AsmA family protein [Formivibrio citricus]SFN30736.1 AsmA-like C-terminal region [Formivibrio citricus]